MDHSIYNKRYQLLKRKMSESAKGFWRVKSLCILNRSLNKKYNPKEALMKKEIERSVPKLPTFIQIKPIQIIYKKKNEGNQTLIKQLFLTSQNKNKTQKVDEKMLTTYYELFGKFPYEPFLYNEYFLKVFPYYKKNHRTFSECVQDSRSLSVWLRKKLLTKSISQKNFEQENKYNLKKTKYQNIIYKNNKKSITIFGNCLRKIKSIKNVSPDNLNLNYSTSDNNIINKKYNESSYSYIN